MRGQFVKFSWDYKILGAMDTPYPLVPSLFLPIWMDHVFSCPHVFLVTQEGFKSYFLKKETYKTATLSIKISMCLIYNKSYFIHFKQGSFPIKKKKGVVEHKRLALFMIIWHVNALSQDYLSLYLCRYGWKIERLWIPSFFFKKKLKSSLLL